jgi:iron-sulfur cluster repair protein YtfE (RIC family)
MDVLEHLEEEHRKVEAMLASLKEAQDPKERSAGLDELASALGTHMAVEEQFLYPLLAEVTDAETAADAGDEHALARKGLAAARERIEEGAFSAAIETLESAIAHHVEEEEHELFPVLRERAGERLAEMDPEDLENRVQTTSSDATRAELYERAKELDIGGRSDMTKDELAHAIEEAS